MQTNWTKNQLQAINKKGKNMLVAAGAGSGKTTVLVERIINKIINENIDIDKLLIVTFTNAAASEMRQRILEAIYERIDKNPQDENLQRQIILLNKANISTIHSFCLEVIKNYSYEIGISSNFRIGDTSEIELLKQETLEEVFENLYEENNEEFIKLVNIYGGYRDDENLKELVLKIYNYSQSMPFPEEWIKESVEKFNIKENIEIDFSKTIWGNILIEYSKEEIIACIQELNEILDSIKLKEDLSKYYLIIENDIELLKSLLSKNTWNNMYESLSNIKFETWTRQSKTDCMLKEECKIKRDTIKTRIKELNKKIFIYSSKEANEDIYEMYNILKSLEGIILEFSKRYKENKEEKNIIDFNDIEHFALKILVRKDEKDNAFPTEAAKIYREKFKEIAIDEYQDSNLVQEYILKAISNENNIFMVGDVKQSIYKFRQARPELFLEKYNKYSLAEDENKECTEDTKIQLFQNFRSRENVLNFANIIFENIMSKKIGDIDYNKSEYLNCSSKYLEPDEKFEFGGRAELNIIDLSSNEEDEEIETQILEKSEIEAKFVANRIKKLINENYHIYDRKKGYRKISYRDIVVLLRTTSGISEIYEKELNKLEIPVFSDTNLNYFETEEIQTILSVLKIIDNPNNDIPLVTVLRSQIGGFSDNELVEIRLNSKNTTYYEALKSIMECEDSKLKQKTKKFLKMLEQWQEKQEILPLNELIWYLYESTNYYDYLEAGANGDSKIANLKLLFEKAKDYEKASFKGLYNFINYIDKISKTYGDSLSAKLVGENENVVRIMSIHKSKGLEFPVVFISGTGKQFNVQDLNENLLLHQDLGIGPKYINYERKIEYNTLAKEAIKIKSLNEILSEEMRLLYVALTRAKEKLIITGCDKNLEKSLLKKETMISNLENNKISIASIRKAKSYLDWIELVYKKEKENLNNVLEVNFYNKDINKEHIEEIINDKIEIKAFNKVDKDIEVKINNILNWNYKYKDNTKIEGKTSVTKIAKTDKEELVELNSTPKFLNNTKKLTQAEIGTLMHLVMQKIDFKIEYNENIISKLINNLVANKIITENESKYINIDKILKFTKSKLCFELKNAKYIYKEKPFYIYMSASEVYGIDSEEKILVQGIIDLYFINKENKLILVDYKTDYIEKDEQELIIKYKPQLDIYKRALQQALKMKVEEVYIYSIHLNKEIKLK